MQAPWSARLALRFDRPNGATRLAHSYHEAPLKVMRAWPAGKACQVMVLHNAGGMVSGDRVAVDVTVEPGAHAVLTTASAGKVYRSEGAVAHQDVTVRVGAGAIAEWRPHETILFRQARFHQTLRVELAPEATFFGWELTRFGRTAMGERFEGGWWRGHTEVWRGETPLWVDRQWLPGEPDALDGAFGLAGAPVVGTLVWLGASVDAARVDALRGAWTGEGEIGVSRLEHGLVCRYRGALSEEARRWFEAVRDRMIASGV
jgi:urease accessory protein